MAETSLDTSQVDRLARDLAASGLKATAQAVAVVAGVASAVETTAQATAPRVTGSLAESIGTDYSAGGLVAEIGPSVYYGRFVEEGTSHQPPQPFLGPAFDAAVGALDSGLVRIVDTTI
jgi:HK97 gp10 family phage protein